MCEKGIGTSFTQNSEMVINNRSCGRIMIINYHTHITEQRNEEI